MARLIKGPFNLKWGDNVLQDIEAVETTYDVDTDEYNTVQGRRHQVEGAHYASINLTLLATDIASLSLILPQYFVPNGGVLSTGETVSNAEGAIDVKAAECDDALINDPFDIESCGNPIQVTRLVNARTRISGLENDGKVQKVLVEVIGEPAQGDGVLQFFKKGTIAVVS